MKDENPVLYGIVRKMCEIAGYSYDEIDWKSGKHLELEWSEEDEQKFIDWLTLHIYSMKLNDLRMIAEFPGFVYRRKKKALKLAQEFVFNFGFKLKKEDDEN